MRQPLAFLLMSCALACAGTRLPSATRSSAARITWHAWGPRPFAEARRTGRIVLADIGIEGCTACRLMAEQTYRDPSVVQRVVDGFVAIQADAHARPDLAARYETVGWPATVFFSPGGHELLAVRGNKQPRNFIRILDDLLAARRDGAGPATPRSHASAGAPQEVDSAGALEAMRTAVLRRLDAMADRRDGGWERGPRQVRQVPVELAILRGRARGEAAERALALLTARGIAHLIDPVWGGVFVAARGPGWDGIIPEKRTVHQAAALAIFSLAHQETREPAWLVRLGAVDRYLREVLQAPDGTFYATQEDAAPGLPPGVTAVDYYALGGAARRRWGIPPVDHAVYTDLNGLAIEGYVRAHEASGEARYLETARRAADRLLATRASGTGTLLQSAPVAGLAVEADDRMRPFEATGRAYLEPQARFGMALLALHRVTGEGRYLQAALAMAGAIVRRLVDRDGALLSAEPHTDDPVGTTRDLRQNAAAARFLALAGWTARDEALTAAATRAMLAWRDSDTLRRAGLFGLDEVALTLELQSLGPVELTVVGDPGEPAVAELARAARSVYEPRKIVRVEPPGHYPASDGPVAYVCDRRACSSPIRDPGELAAAAARFATP